MSFSDQIGKEFDELREKRLDHTVKSATVNLYSDLVKASPVDTGELKASWQTPEQMGKRKFVIRNIAPHAQIIDGGYRKVPTQDGGEKSVGSRELKNGFGPIIEQTEKALQRKFDK